MRAADRGRRCFGVRRKGHEGSEGDQVAHGTSPAAKDDGLSLRPARDRTASRPNGGGDRRIDAHASANGGQSISTIPAVPLIGASPSCRRNAQQRFAGGGRLKYSSCVCAGMSRASHRSEEQTSELQSLIRSSLSVY